MKTRRIANILFVLMLFGLNIACRKSLTEPSPVPKPQPGYTLFVVKVLDNAGVGVNNASVEITGSVNHQAVTDSSGAMNVQLPYGNYNVSVASFSFDGSSQSIKLDQSNEELIFNILRVNAIRIINIDPLCGTLNLPYVFNVATIKVEFSVAEPYEYPIFGYLDTALSVDGNNAIPNSGRGTRFGYSYQGQTTTTVGLLDYHRNTISNTMHILHKLSVKHIDDAGKDIGVLHTQAYECFFGFK